MIVQHDGAGDYAASDISLLAMAGFTRMAGARLGLSGGGMMPALLSKCADYPQLLHALVLISARIPLQ